MTRRCKPIARIVAIVALLGIAGATTSFAQQSAVPAGRPPAYAPGVPPVLLSTAHAKLCKLHVGDVFPGLELPQLNGEVTTIQRLAGDKATVVLFWSSDRWMSGAALRDLGRDVVSRFDPKQVALIGVAVDTDVDAVHSKVRQTGAAFPQLIDADGAALGQVGSARLPRIFVLDETAAGGQRTIAWFDIEYSEATRRELRQTLRVLTTPNASKAE